MIAALTLISMIIGPQPGGVQAGGSNPGQVFNLQIAQRNGRESCWVQYASGNKRKICISHSLWIQYLHSNNLEPLALGNSSQWKVFSPLRNTSKSNFFNQSGKQKQIFFRKYLKNNLQDSATIKHKIRVSDQANKDQTNKNQATENQFNFNQIVSSLVKKLEIIRENVSEVLRPNDPLGILRSLILHEGTSSGTLSVFRKLGFVHLVTATGIHLYSVISWIDFIAYRLSRVLGLKIKMGLRLSRFFSYSLCFILWLLGGARMGMLRPFFILTLKYQAQAWGIHWKKGAPLGCAIILDLLVGLFRYLNHEETPASGRWIYALAVGGGLFWAESFRFQHLGLAVGSWILVALVEIWETGWVALATPLISLITLPIVCSLVYPIIVFSFLLSSWGFKEVSTKIIQTTCSGFYFLFFKLETLSKLTGNLWLIDPKALVAGILIAAFICLSRSRIKTKVIYLIILLGFRLSLVAYLGFKSKTNLDLNLILEATKVVQLDVGQGDSALVIGGQAGRNEIGGNRADGAQVGLIDVGSSHTLNDDQWLQILGYWRAPRISWIALTHLDEDHSGGLLSLSRVVKIGCIATSSAELLSRRGQIFSKQMGSVGIPVTEWSQCCVPFPVLGPLATPKVTQLVKARSETTRSKKARYKITHARSADKNSGNANMSAIWIPLINGGFYLSAGDADARSEIRISNWAKNLSAQRKVSRILKVSHHGSRHSTTEQWIHTIQPTEAWISVGQGNSYGHPSVQTLQILKELNIPVRRTDEQGAIESP